MEATHFLARLDPFPQQTQTAPLMRSQRFQLNLADRTIRDVVVDSHRDCVGGVRLSESEFVGLGDLQNGWGMAGCPGLHHQSEDTRTVRRLA